MRTRGAEMAKWLALMACVVTPVMACAREGGVESGPGGSVGQAGPDTVTGLVRQVGNVPFARTIIQGDDTVTVAGEYEGELTRLVGTRVRATGELTTGGMPGPHLRVTSYEILSVDGVRPHVGILGRDDEGYFLETSDGTSLRLGAVPLRLERTVGGRVWVILGQEGSVARYGILREPPGQEEEPEGAEGRGRSS